MAGLGRSPTAQHYALAGLHDARAYLGHAVLGPRLLECCRALLGFPRTSAEQVLGSIDRRGQAPLVDDALRRADPEEAVFTDVLDRFFDGAPDERTIELLG